MSDKTRIDSLLIKDATDSFAAVHNGSMRATAERLYKERNKTYEIIEIVVGGLNDVVFDLTLAFAGLSHQTRKCESL